jgi:hypothetical protein
MELDSTSDVSTLYVAATESLVSDQAGNSTFEKMLRVAYTHAGVETFVKEVKETELKIKKDFEITSMPGPWRSAKSVVCGAMKLNISLIDSNGQCYGKTFLQNKIKEMKDKPEVTLDEYVQKIINSLISTPSHLDGETVYTRVKEFIEGQ